MKSKIISKKRAYWISVAIVGVIFGITLQFARAWIAPGAPAPGANIGAPITTSQADQTKAGGIMVGSAGHDLVIGNGGKICLNGSCISSWPTGSSSVSTTVINPGSSYTPGEWFSDKLKISYTQSDPDGNWAKTQTTSFVAPHALEKLRLRGSSNDGGYCYVYWGTGHIAITRHAGSTGIYNVDGKYYPYTVSGGSYSPTLVCGSGRNGICNETCPRGGNLNVRQDICVISTVYNCPTPTPSFSDDGTAKLCEYNYDAGDMTTSEQAVNIPEGTTVTLQGRHTIGDKEDNINCALDIQYAP